MSAAGGHKEGRLRWNRFPFESEGEVRIDLCFEGQHEQNRLYRAFPLAGQIQERLSPLTVEGNHILILDE